MKIPRQSKPVRRAGFTTRLKIKDTGSVMPSMVDDDDVDEDIADTEEESDFDDADDAGDDSFEGLDEAI